MPEYLKPLLTTYAYNILGTLEDAEDVVQDVFLKYHTADKTSIRDERAYLVRMVINLSINLKKKLKRTLEDYPGQWLPEPVSTETPLVLVERKEVISYSMMVLLEKLTPKQRAVFILKEAFDYTHDEIAEVLDISIDHSRQILKRAKNELQKNPARADSVINSKNLDKYVRIIQTGDMEGLEQLLYDEINVISDGGGKIVAFLNKVSGKKAVGALLSGIHKKYYANVRIERAEINHEPALFYYDNNELVTCQILIFEEGILQNVYFIRNPDKLKILKKISA